MNVLLVNPPFPLSFWTLPDLCKFDGSKTTGPPLGLITVAALLPSSWSLRLVDMNCRGVTENDWEWAHVVMISSMIAQKTGMLAVIREAKKRDKVVVVGGPYPTSLPQDALAAGADFPVQGEAENCIHELAQALESGKNGGMLRSEEKPSMTLSPVPRFDLLKLDDYTIMGVQTSRGCPFDCEFCDIVHQYGRKPRYKTPDQVIRELDALYQSGWRKDVLFTDDNFIGSRSDAKAILEGLMDWNERKGMPFGYWCQASINLGQDLEMIDLMTQANFRQVFIGVESPDKEILESYRKYHNIHNPLAESLHNINKNGLEIVASFILGFDGEAPGAGRRICEFVEETGLASVMVGTLRAIPNTKLWERLKREGRLIEEIDDWLFDEGQMNFVPTRSQSEIHKEFEEAWKRLYEPRNFLERAYRYYRTMKPAPQAFPHKKEPLGRKLRSLWALSHMIWWQGIVYPSRARFWRRLFSMRRTNPTRLTNYMQTSLFGLVLFRFSKAMLRRRRKNTAG